MRNVLVRGSYQPLQLGNTLKKAIDRIATEFTGGQLTADELLVTYCTLMYSKTGSCQAAARELKLDRRTVKSKVGTRMLAEIQQTETKCHL